MLCLIGYSSNIIDGVVREVKTWITQTKRRIVYGGEKNREVRQLFFEDGSAFVIDML